MNLVILDMRHVIVLTILWWLPRLTAQPIQLKIYSEFQRVDPFGEIVAVDRAEKPREILSPAVARNAYASFHIVVKTPPGTPFILYLGQNPEDTFKLTLYREWFTQAGGMWIPDRLERVLEPYDSRLQPRAEDIAGRSVTAFWLDVWVPAEARVRRVRLEAQLNVSDRWVIAPMEVRIRPARVPDFATSSGPLPPVEAPADQAALGPLRSFLCGAEEPVATGPVCVRRFIRRNAQQDMALARELERRLGRAAVLEGILQAVGASELEAWCRQPSGRPGLGAEWYLRVRDYLLRTAQ